MGVTPRAFIRAGLWALEALRMPSSNSNLRSSGQRATGLREAPEVLGGQRSRADAPRSNA